MSQRLACVMLWPSSHRVLAGLCQPRRVHAHRSRAVAVLYVRDSAIASTISVLCGLGSRTVGSVETSALMATPGLALRKPEQC